MRGAKERGSALIDLIFGGFMSMLLMLIILRAIAAVNVGRTAHREGAHLALGARALQTLLYKQGASIVMNGTAAGFTTPYAPTGTELRAAGYLPKFVRTTTPFGGTLQFTVRRSAANDLLGLACESNSVTKRGAPAPDIAAQVMSASGGTGLMTTTVAPAVLNGPGMPNIASPISGPAVVCAWAYLSNPV